MYVQGEFIPAPTSSPPFYAFCVLSLPSPGSGYVTAPTATQEVFPENIKYIVSIIIFNFYSSSILGITFSRLLGAGMAEFRRFRQAEPERRNSGGYSGAHSAMT